MHNPTSTTCARCPRPSRDTATLCDPCTGDLRKQLLALAAHGGDLVDNVTRTARHGAGGARPPGAELPLVVNLGAADTLWAVGNTIVTWMLELARVHDLPLPRRTTPDPLHGPLCPAGWCRHRSCATIRNRPAELTGPHPVAAAAAWLAAHVDLLRQHPDAVDAYDELDYAANTAAALASGPLQHWYAGPCSETTEAGEECTQDLLGRPGAHTIRCRACGARHDAAARRAWLLEQARDVADTASALAAVATALGHRTTAAAVRGYAHRGRLDTVDHDERDRPRYRFGQLIDLITACPATPA